MCPREFVGETGPVRDLCAELFSAGAGEFRKKAGRFGRHFLLSPAYLLMLMEVFSESTHNSGSSSTFSGLSSSLISTGDSFP